MTTNGPEPSSPTARSGRSNDCCPSSPISIPDCLPQTCCCGNSNCTFLRQSYAVVEGLEESLRTAGSLGQALLVRHEAYVAEAEKEKSRMGAEIKQLSTEKQQLEVKNASITEENQGLLFQLESVNDAVTESDIHIQSLNATLQSTQAELHKLNNLASRTDRLERELELYEQEQASLQAALACKTEQERSVTLRWQEAERKLATLEDQLDEIHREAKEERERHVEIVGRMERQRVVEKELNTASGRLRGAAAAKTSNRDKHGSTVVSHFVKDILQDNANLQMGIVELRDLLTSSNDEVERLREQLAQFQPQEQEFDPEEQTLDSRRQSSLGLEMSRASTQELHVHHHYHAPSDTSSRRQSQTLRRPKKKRQGLTPGAFAPSLGARTPRSSISAIIPFSPSSSTGLAPTSSSSSATILSQTAVTVPTSKNPPARWSMQSAYTFDSSIASSPPSTTCRAPSLFDRGFSDAGMDSSRPTTPDSEDLGSPLFLPTQYQSKRGSAGYFRSIPAPPFRHGGQDDTTPFDQSSDTISYEADGDISAMDHGTILEEDEPDLHAADDPASPDRHASDFAKFQKDSNTPPRTDQDIPNRTHRRVGSHESLISIHGMDIHTLKSRPSQLLTARSPRPFTGGRSFSSQPVVSATMAHAARPAMTPRTSDPSHSLLSGMAADQRAISAGASANKAPASRKAGGWLFGRWGFTPTPTVTVSTPLEHMKVQKVRETATTTKATASPTKLRPPGINQPGPILGFRTQPVRVPQPVLVTLDEEALRQSLSEA